MKRLLAVWFRRPWLGRAFALGLAGLLALAGWGWGSDSLRQLQERGSDLVWRFSASDRPEHRIVLIDIDDASLSQLGPWPWTRQTMAQLVRKLDAHGAGLKLFDVVFADARDGDAEFSRALAAHDATAPAVLAQVFALRNESQLRLGRLAGALPGVGCQAPGVPAQGYVANAAGLHPRAGHITPTLDADGAVRRIPAIVCMDEKSYPALALAGVAALGGSGPENAASPSSLRISPGTGPWQPAWQLHLASLPGHPVGIDGQGQIRVPYLLQRRAFVSISAADLLNDKVPAGMLQGAWVLVGASAFGLADVVPTALGGGVSGAEVHLQLLSALLDGKLPATPRAAPWLQGGYVLLAVLGLLALAAGRPLHSRRRVLLLPLVALGAAAGAIGLHAVALLQAGWYIGWLGPAFGIVLAGVFLGLGEQARALVEKGRIYQNLASYVSGPVAEKIALAAPTGDIQARRCDVTVLVADVQNFSRYCEMREPEDAALLLHRFFGTASAVVEAHGGVIEEMVGDSLLAVFNGSHPCKDHPVAALSAAREIWQRCSEDLPNTHGLGLEPLGIGVGLETGTAMVGSFGPANRRVHTVLGQIVTIALRLQAQTADLAYPVLIGQGLAQRLGVQPDSAHLALKPLGSFLLPGLQQSCSVFTLRNLLQPGGLAEQRALMYLRQQQQQPDSAA